MACGNPEDVKVRRRDTKEVIPKTGGPQKYKSYDKTMGFQCYNKDQVDGQCLDYEISLCCPAGEYCFVKRFFFLFEGKISFQITWTNNSISAIYQGLVLILNKLKLEKRAKNCENSKS